MTEDVKNLPEVKGLENLDGVQDMLQDKGAEEVKEPPKVQATPEGEIDLEQFKNPKELLKSYKEIQGFVTRISQENKQYKTEIDQLREQMEMVRLQTPPPQQPQQPRQKDFDSMFIENPQQAVASVASQAVQQQLHTARIAEVLDEEFAKNPNDYQERYNYAQYVSRQYPQLVNSAPGVRKHFEIADKQRKVDYEKRARESVKLLFGDDVDMEQLKNLVRKNPQAQNSNMNAYMPDTTMSSRTGTESGSKVNMDTEINESVKKGDPDAVLNALFKKHGLR